MFLLKLADDMAPLSTSMLELSVTTGGVVELSTAHSWSVPAAFPVSTLSPTTSMHATWDVQWGRGHDMYMHVCGLDSLISEGMVLQNNRHVLCVVSQRLTTPTSHDIT